MFILFLSNPKQFFKVVF